MNTAPEFIKNTLEEESEDHPRRAPSNKVIALNRMSYGCTKEMIALADSKGLNAFIESQLHPSQDEGPIVTEKINSATLHIKYPEKEDSYPAVDEDRPLSVWNSTLENLWALTNNKATTAGPERSRPLEELRVVTWIRAVYSPWQLQETLVEFWHNHFNVNASSDLKISVTLPVYDRDVIRKNCFGNFRQFLEDVATSTAMQFYLDNSSSKASPANENYARELFELHTLGADNYFNNLYNRWREVPGATSGKPIGYIDEDVYEAARAFTGWTIANGANTGKGEKLPDTGAFHYYDGWHDNYQKRVLGVEFDSNQPPLSDGKKVLDLVAYHPATAMHVCKKLCRWYISDSPSDKIVKDAAAVWTKNQKSANQIKETIRFILHSNEFNSNWGQKVKRPFELIASMIRATGVDFTPNASLTGMLSQMGYFHFQWPTPTGHPDKKEYWLSSSSMLARWNLSLALLANPNSKLTKFQYRALMPETMQKPLEISSFWIDHIFQKPMPEEFSNIMLQHFANHKNPNEALSQDQIDKRLPSLIALLTMTPDFHLK
jgi:uncharacterized protein (DUF1800 family)